MQAPTVVRNPTESSSTRCFGPQTGEFTLSKGRISEPVAPKNAAVTYDGGKVIRQAQRSWSGISAVVSDVRCDGNLCLDFDRDRTTLSASLDEVGSRLEIRPKIGPSVSRGKPGPLSLIPAGLGAHGQAT